MTTPKLSNYNPQPQIHQTTIVEENETMRGSIDRPPIGAFQNKNTKSKAAIKHHNQQVIEKLKQEA